MSKLLRAHHVLCTTLFEGKGYSGGFCAGMENVVRQLRKNPDTPLLVVCIPDEICRNCPNLTEQNICSSDHNKISGKDKRLWQILQLQEQEEYTYRELQIRVKKYLNKQNFDEICGNCNWNKQGLCSYEKLMRQLPDDRT
ncbi:MAG: DUF1284 domain-containing protein [Lachnospiraceae bacterium]|nr:DUF1284 domain-containing protein [Lachnospiraceae bacterium]